MDAFNPTLVFRSVDLLGVVTNSLLGAAVARRLNFDLVGFLTLAIISALGGGMLRDMLIGQGIPVAFTDPAYLVLATAGGFVGYLMKVEGRWTNRGLVVADALSLGCWSATGVIKALGVGLGWMPALIMGVTTAVGGGMIRDISVGKIPAIFGGNTLYASVAIVGSAQMVVLAKLGRPNVGMAVSIATCAGLGVLARWQRWQLPGAAEIEVPALPPMPGMRTRRRRKRRGGPHP